MIKKITVLCLIFLIVFSISGCSKGKDEIVNSATNENKSELVDDVGSNISDDEIEYEESKTREEIENIENEFLQGNMKEAEYHSKKVEFLIVSNGKIEKNDKLVKKNQENIPIDLSYDLQWMSDNYNNLDKNQKEIFDKLNNLYVKKEKESSFFNKIIKKVYAEEIDETYEADFNENVKFYAENLGEGIIY
ncbi:hypothetical protein QUF55_09170, partial [Clostridiaceae bacterium HSG29]|nr:hypothetical protein [Clostridiaceae bacterium HSG29]